MAGVASHDDELAPQPLATARALAARWYTRSSTNALDRRQIFAPSWQLVAHVAQVARPGDFLATDVAGLPVVVVRDGDDRIRAYHNVCRHRAGNVAEGAGCGAKRLRCRYHGWVYGLDGVLRNAPEMRDAEDFVPADIRLPELEVSTWQGLIFVSERPSHALDRVVEGMDARMAPRGLPAYRFHRHVEYIVEANWKVYVDNYLEGYHVPQIHPTLAKVLDYRDYVTQTAALHSVQVSPVFDATGLYGRGEALYYYLWPNTMLNSLPDRLQVNRVIPLGHARCRIDFDYYYPSTAADDVADRCDRDVEFSDQVQSEDAEICGVVQRGLASGSYTPGRLNPVRENAVHHFHELVRAAYRAARAEGAAEAAN